MGERDIQEGGDVCICKPDLLLFTAETNKTLQSNYTLKIFLTMKQNLLSIQQNNEILTVEVFYNSTELYKGKAFTYR